MTIPAHLRRRVIQRAKDRCEYCGLSQIAQEAAFHIDHVIPVIAGGKTSFQNLALACVSCSLRKAARTLVTDPNSGKDVSIFNPRKDSWRLHFRWNGIQIVGISPTGRATAAALDMNRKRAKLIRQQERIHQRHPPPSHL